MNGITVLLISLNSKNLIYEIRAIKARKSERNKKKRDDNAMLSNTLWSDRRRPKDSFLKVFGILSVLVKR